MTTGDFRDGDVFFFRQVSSDELGVSFLASCDAPGLRVPAVDRGPPLLGKMAAFPMTIPLGPLGGLWLSLAALEDCTFGPDLVLLTVGLVDILLGPSLHLTPDCRDVFFTSASLSVSVLGSPSTLALITLVSEFPSSSSMKLVSGKLCLKLGGADVCLFLESLKFGTLCDIECKGV